MSERAPLTPEERALPYAKFYDLPITPFRRKRWRCWRAGLWIPLWP